MGLFRVSCQHFSCLILIIATFLSCGTGMTLEIKFSQPTGKIVSGRNTNHGKLPYLVSIQTVNRQRAFCGGAILDNMTILTAAHCFTQRACKEDSENCYKIVAGEHDLKHHEGPEQPVDFSMSDVVIHEHFDHFHYDNDIALIRLKTPLIFSPYVGPIALIDPKIVIEHRHHAEIAGWGKTKYNSDHDVQILQMTEVEIFSNQYCQNQWGDDFHAETMICAGATSIDSRELVSDACQGDSGGPLMSPGVDKIGAVKTRYVVGIISWGYECGLREYPGLYTKVEVYLDWIHRNRQIKTWK